jgi:hypothetical protein
LQTADEERTYIKIKYVGWPKTERNYRTGFTLKPTKWVGSTSGRQLPLLAVAMMKERNAVLVRAAKSQQEIKSFVNMHMGIIPCQ